MHSDNNNTKHWLYRRQNRPKLWIILVVILLAVLLPDFFIHPHHNFEDQGVLVDGSWGFYGWYGFISCVVMVVLAKLIGIFLKRKESFYDD